MRKGCLAGKLLRAGGVSAIVLIESSKVDGNANPCDSPKPFLALTKETGPE
jgi:hypothetical protein